MLSIRKDVKLCSVYARRANQNDVEKNFLALVTTAPQPLVSEKKTDKVFDTSKNGKAHTLGFVWGTPGAPRGLAFMLTTYSSDDAEIQAHASATVVSD